MSISSMEAKALEPLFDCPLSPHASLSIPLRPQRLLPRMVMVRVTQGRLSYPRLPEPMAGRRQTGLFTALSTCLHVSIGLRIALSLFFFSSGAIHLAGLR